MWLVLLHVYIISVTLQFQLDDGHDDDSLNLEPQKAKAYKIAKIFGKLFQQFQFKKMAN